MPGPPPLPSSIKRMRGTWRQDRANPHEPRPKSGAPRRPAWLTPRARKFWPEYVKLTSSMQVLTHVDGPALGMLCQAHAEYLDAIDVITKEGASYETPTQNGRIVRARPEVQQASEAWRRVQAMLQQFGLTPASRARVDAKMADPEHDEIARRLFGPRDPLNRFIKPRNRSA
jgi:P27 family predicted phage terminase small subunit